jgi:hypothetical protein
VRSLDLDQSVVDSLGGVDDLLKLNNELVVHEFDTNQKVVDFLRCLTRARGRRTFLSPPGQLRWGGAYDVASPSCSRRSDSGDVLAGLSFQRGLAGVSLHATTIDVGDIERSIARAEICSIGAEIARSR